MDDIHMFMQRFFQTLLDMNEGKEVGGGRILTTTSTSLVTFSSPRATEPKIPRAGCGHRVVFDFLPFRKIPP
jgi:hypothetical protein